MYIYTYALYLYDSICMSSPPVPFSWCCSLWPPPRDLSQDPAIDWCAAGWPEGPVLASSGSAKWLGDVGNHKHL